MISRGYGGSRKRREPGSVGQGPVMDAAQAGDEPVLMARMLGAPVAVGPERFVAGQVMLAACGPRVLVGDDLFQHRDLHRDLNIAVLPWTPDPIGRGGCCPGAVCASRPGCAGRMPWC